MTGYRCDGCQQWQEGAPRWTLIFYADVALYRFDSMACISLWLDSRVTEAVR